MSYRDVNVSERLLVVVADYKASVFGGCEDDGGDACGGERKRESDCEDRDILQVRSGWACRELLQRRQAGVCVLKALERVQTTAGALFLTGI